MKTLVVIPARYKSKRFPAKVIHPILGKPLVMWVYERAKKIHMADEIIVATDHKDVYNLLKSAGAKVTMTSPNHKSGTDRIWEAVKNIKCDYVINLQADEPFININAVEKALKLLISDKSFDITTAAVKIKEKKEITDPNCVKVAVSHDKTALYFSRSPVPYHHELSPLYKKYPYYKHCGFYVYRKNSLKKFVSLKPSKLEILERLEQLRALENGMKIGIIITDKTGPAVDTKEDIKSAEKYYINLLKGRR